MQFQNINSNTMKAMNLRTVLEAIWRRSPVSRKELAAIVGLTTASITNIVSHLIALGLVSESGAGDSHTGRKPIMLQVQANARYAVGVEMNAAHTVCLMVDLTAKVAARATMDTRPEDGPDVVVSRINGLIGQVIAQSGVPRERIAGVGLVAPGPLNSEEGKLLNPPNFPGWEDFPIVHRISSAVGLPVWLERDAVGAAMAEHWFGESSGPDGFAMICLYDVGIGAAFFIDGKPFKGFRGGAGEIGHIMIEPEGLPCVCGNRGCLETRLSDRVLRQEYLKRTGVELDAQLELIRRARSGDPHAADCMRSGARSMAVALGQTIHVLSPEVMYMAGDLPVDYPEFMEMVTEAVRQRPYPPHTQQVKIVPCSFGRDQGAIGGAGMVFGILFESLEV